jgi:NADH-quinone oxidoreductase subunit J
VNYSLSDALFVGFSLFSLLCAFGVVFARNAIYSAFSLILCFFGLAGLYLLWSATFIAMIQVLIYTGAIVVLFVFVVMLLNLQNPTVATGRWLTGVLSAAGAWFFALFLVRALNRSAFAQATTSVAGDMRTISKLLFTDYLWPFEILSVFMLALIVAIYALARPETPEEEAIVDAERRQREGRA